MLNRIRALLGMAGGRVGYVYAAKGETGPMQDARVGGAVRLPDRGPPWIVVDFDLAKMTVTRWPGRLWRVRVMEAATERDQRVAGGPPNDQANYVRAIAVRVLNEEDPARLFGPHGGALIALFDGAARITRDQAQRLARSRHADAAGAYDRAMRRWASGENLATPSADLDGALKIGGRSPINAALAVLHGILFERAHAIDGAHASSELDNDVSLVEPWATAAQTMGDAALAIGAPELMSMEDRAALVSAYAGVLRGPA
ncbi:MAG: hypothetical protein ACK4MV_13355 [Beijerinckiaceae bacterium]